MEREHYYYCLRTGPGTEETCIYKAYNRKQVLAYTRQKKEDILARFRHYLTAKTFCDSYNRHNHLRATENLMILTNNKDID